MTGHRMGPTQLERMMVFTSCSHPCLGVLSWSAASSEGPDPVPLFEHLYQHTNELTFQPRFPPNTKCQHAASRRIKGNNKMRGGREVSDVESMSYSFCI
eukprot:768375-Hanusia_phi.AAC.12